MSEDFPEAGAVAFTSWKRPDGFIVNFTVRDQDGKQAYARIDGAIKQATKDGCTPYERSFSKPAKPIEYVENRVCPTCGAKLVYAQKKDGTKFIKCSTNKYMNGQSIGCSYVDWMNGGQGVNPPAHQGEPDY